MATSVMFSMSGVNKQRFIEQVKADPQTYKDWTGNGEWDIETSGQGGRPVLAVPAQALQAGGGRRPHPGEPHHHRRHLGRGLGSRRSHLSQSGAPAECDGTDPRDLTTGEIVGRHQAIMAIKALKRLHARMRGCEAAQFRHDLGVRDTRKIDALYNLTGEDVRDRAGSRTRSASFPEFIDGYGILILPTTGPLFPCPLSLAAARKACRADRRGPLHRRRQGVARRGAQHDVLCRSGTGGGYRGGDLVKTGQPFDRLDIRSVQAELIRQGARIALGSRHDRTSGLRLSQRLRQRDSERGAAGRTAAWAEIRRSAALTGSTRSSFPAPPSRRRGTRTGAAGSTASVLAVLAALLAARARPHRRPRRRGAARARPAALGSAAAARRSDGFRRRPGAGRGQRRCPIGTRAAASICMRRIGR